MGVYAVVLTALCQFIEYATENWTEEGVSAVKFEVLLPAFAFGALVETPCAVQELAMQQLERAHQQSAPALASATAQQPLVPSMLTSTSSLSRYGLPRPVSVSAASRTTSRDKDVQGSGISGAPVPAGEAEDSNQQRPEPKTVETLGDMKPSDATATVAEEAYWEELVHTTVVAAFMVLVGLSIPALFGENAEDDQTGGLSSGMIVLHCVVVTVVMNIGKMVPTTCYSKEASMKQRVALSSGMCPRGEVGASVVVIALHGGMSGPIVIVAIVCLAVNLLMCGVFVSFTKRLLREEARRPSSFRLSRASRVSDV